jgi:hypothetical protein
MAGVQNHNLQDINKEKYRKIRYKFRQQFPRHFKLRHTKAEVA